MCKSMNISVLQCCPGALNYAQRYASFETGSSKKNARTTNACTYYVSTYDQDKRYRNAEVTI